MSFVNFLKSLDGWPVSVTLFVLSRYEKVSVVTHAKSCSSCVASSSSWSPVRMCPAVF